jgi:hypothetical protein
MGPDTRGVGAGAPHDAWSRVLVAFARNKGAEGRLGRTSKWCRSKACPPHHAAPDGLRGSEQPSVARLIPSKETLKDAHPKSRRLRIVRAQCLARRKCKR